ncbi:hypothetical protein ACQ4PT_011786 [Festuca glaucescens]
MAWAATLSPTVSPNTVFRSYVQGHASSSPSAHRIPVLEPSVFVLEKFDAAEWVAVQRKPRREAMQRRQEAWNPRRRQSPASSSDQAVYGKVKFPFPVSRHGHNGPISRSGHRAQGYKKPVQTNSPGHKGLVNQCDGTKRLIHAKPNPNPMSRVLGLAWTRSSGTARVVNSLTALAERTRSGSSMAGRGNMQGGGGGGAGSGAPPQNPGQIAPGGYRQSTFERGSGSGYGNGRGGGQGYSQSNNQNFQSGNTNNFRAAPGFPHPNPRNANSGYDNGQFRGGGNRWLQNDGWNGENNYDHTAFGGDFGDFDQGYFDAGQGHGQNNGGHGGAQRNRRIFWNQAQAVQSVGADLSKASKKKDKADGVLCFRCDDTGHMAIDCTAELCLCCDSAKHKSAECHLHAMPKPAATMYGLCRDELLFFDIPKTLGVKSKRSNGKIGKIRVEGGELTAHQVVKELSFLIPGDHQWEITKTADNVFKVVYPTKADFARVRKINDIKVDDTGCTIFFEEWSTQKFEVEGRVPNVPEDLDMLDADHGSEDKGNASNGSSEQHNDNSHVEPSKDSSTREPMGNNTQNTNAKQLNEDLPLISTQFGSLNRESHLETSRDHHLCKSVPAAPEPTLPKSVPLKCFSTPIKTWGKRVEYDEEDLLSSPPRIEKCGGLEEVPQHRCHDKLQHDQQQIGASGHTDAGKIFPAAATKLLPLFSAEADEGVLSLKKDIVQMQCSSLSSFSSEHTDAVYVHGTPHDEPQWHEAEVRPPSPSGNHGRSSGGSPKSRGAGQGLGTPLQLSMHEVPRDSHRMTGTGVFLGGRYTQTDLIAFGGIPEPKVVGVRSSPRICLQPNSDVTQLERA